MEIDYKNKYESLIDYCKNYPPEPDEYFEVHHIIPRCLGGSNKSDNLIHVTAENHIKLHILLFNMYPDNLKIAFAANCMLNGFGKDNNSKQLKSRIDALNDIDIDILAETRENYIKLLRKAGIVTSKGTAFKAKKLSVLMSLGR